MIDVADMPPEVLAAFELYLHDGRRNASEVARLCGTPRPTVQRWSERYGWRDRAADIDRDHTDAAITDARARHARRLGEADTVIGLALRARIGPDGTPYSTDDSGKHVDAPAPMATRAALAVYANHGIKPPQHVTLDVRQPAALPYTAAELNAMLAAALASGDTATLLALQSGRLPTAPPPTDFASDQPGGRAVPGPTLPVPGESVFDAHIVDTSDPASMRFSHPNGDDDEEVPQG